MNTENSERYAYSGVCDMFMHCIQQYCNYLPVNKAFIISYYSSSGAIFTHAPLSSYVSSRQTFPYYYNCLMASFFRTTWVSQYQKGKTSLDLNEAKEDGDDSGISWTICKQSAPHSQQTTTPPLSLNFLQTTCSFWCPTNRVKALKACTVPNPQFHHKKNI